MDHNIKQTLYILLDGETKAIGKYLINITINILGTNILKSRGTLVFCHHSLQNKFHVLIRINHEREHENNEKL